MTAQLYVAMNRVDLASKTVAAMNSLDDDDTLSQLAHAHTQGNLVYSRTQPRTGRATARPMTSMPSWPSALGPLTASTTPWPSVL